MITPDEIALRHKLAAACEPLARRWPDFWLSLYERDAAAGNVAAWAAPSWFAKRLPAPLLNDVGREFESARFLDNVRSGTDVVYRIAMNNQAADWRARGYRNLFYPGDFFGEAAHGTPRVDVDYALDGPAADLVMRLLGEERGYRQEIDCMRAHAALRELGACGTLTPPALMMPPGHELPPTPRNLAVPLVADFAYLRSRAGNAPQLVVDADGFEAFPDMYRKLVPEVCGWTLDKRVSRKNCEVFSDGRGGELFWALELERPTKRDLRFPQLVLCGSGRKAPRLVLPGGEARPILEFGISPRGHEVNLRQQWTRFQALMEFYRPALG